ncbi:hypothetical protein PTTG_27788 [Puccinia triticina 1-1 BBBD Race 1]|uniref:Uncharacterized protein n=1 Tax=Puccinia triticina (isolate 1-1 / race 1 (BBBD)) TaxID=630390 RepID=A0A180GH84_PUCT1|nr:hypothetical protein PTTG_27788 [Puccinia triticina 1-1 BBBD Race 1]
MDPAKDRQSTSRSATTSNWNIDDLSHRARLEEDIAILQSNLERLPPSPDTTVGQGCQKGKAPQNKPRDPAPADERGPLPHMDPRLPRISQIPPLNVTDDAPPVQRRPARYNERDELLAKEIRDFEEAEFHL